MAAQKLVNVFSVTLAGGEQSYVQPHGLFLSNGVGAIPHQITCDQASPIGVVSCDATNIVFRNLSSDEKTAVFRAEYDHSIYSAGPPPLYWRGVDAPAPASSTLMMVRASGAVTTSGGQAYENPLYVTYGHWFVSVVAHTLHSTLSDDDNRLVCDITEDVALSVPGPLGTLAIRVKPRAMDWAGRHSIRSITLSTLTTTKTQAKLLVIIDFSDFPDAGFRPGWLLSGYCDPRSVAYPVAVFRSTSGSQSLTPIVTLANEDGSPVQSNGVPNQFTILPGAWNEGKVEEGPPCIRVSVAGLSKADADVVTDPAFNKLQSLTIQF